MSKSPWWAFENDGPDDQDDTLTALEKRALDALHDLQAYERQHPERVLAVGATARKVSTVFGSFAQTLSLQVASMPRGKAKA